jgi:hypothetical protein
MSTPSDPPPSAAGILGGIFLPEVSTLDDLERHLKLPRDQIIEELATGRLRGLKVAEQWLVHRDAVKAWLNVHGSGR